MGSYVIRLKILPKEPNADSGKIVESIRTDLPQYAQIRGQKVEPIAFGLEAIILDVVAPESEGSIDAVEKAVGGAPLVGQCDLVGVSRLSSKLPPA